MTVGLAERIALVEYAVVDAARRAGRSRADVQLLAVSKTVDAAVIRDARQLGLCAFGENRAQDLVMKAGALAVTLPDAPCTWHMIGALQRNKVAMLAPEVALWHTVDRVALIDELARRAPGARVLLEVNIASEVGKAGCAPSSVSELRDYAAANGLVVAGLMCIPPALDDPRPHFEWMAKCAQRESLLELSMGMSNDFAIAIEYGATIVRIGTAIFGPRPSPDGARN